MMIRAPPYYYHALGGGLTPGPPPPTSTFFHLHPRVFSLKATSPQPPLTQLSSSSFSSSASSYSSESQSQSHPTSSLRCAVVGAGFAGLSVASHLLLHSSRKELNLRVDIDIFDEFGIGGGASGVAGGLLHPYSPKMKLLWRGGDFWRECLYLLNLAQQSNSDSAWDSTTTIPPYYALKTDHNIITRRGIVRPAINEKNLEAMCENAKNCLPSCRIETIDSVAAKNLIPNLCTPLNTAFFMPEALNVYPQNYLEALFRGCENFVQRMSSTGFPGKRISLHKKYVASLHELDEYDVVVVCVGARVNMLNELSGVLPLRTCRGIVANLQLPDVAGGDIIPDHSPSILSDAWMAVQGCRNLSLGSTWEWGSREYGSTVSSEEATRSLENVLLPKATTVFPEIRSWKLRGGRAGVRAMPPVTPQGSFPLLGSIDDIVGGDGGREHCGSKYWLIGGLGSRGLLYHGWLGKLTAQAVLSGDEKIIPPELTFWRKMIRK